ncbi:MAG TPA: TlpA disulfide reductase family protein [Micromonospora sp.]
MNRRLPALLLPLLLLTGACSTAEPEPVPATSEAAAPFADCATLTTPLPTTNPVTSASTPPGAPAGELAGVARELVGKPLPDLSLPCFTGGRAVSLAGIRGPALINLWASSCAPCRHELPAFQRLSERTEGRLRIIGVDTRDSRAAARSLGEDLGLRFPNLYDRDEQLRTHLGLNFLPITLAVDGEGRIRHVDMSGALDDQKLATLVGEHLGVVVAG